MSDILPSVVIMIGLFISLCIGVHLGQESADKEWTDSAEREKPVVKKGIIYKVEFLGGDE